jgi:hypothetical protein
MDRFGQGRHGSVERGGHNLDHLGSNAAFEKFRLLPPRTATAGRTGSSYFVGAT